MCEPTMPGQVRTPGTNLRSRQKDWPPSGRNIPALYIGFILVISTKIDSVVMVFSNW